MPLRRRPALSQEKGLTRLNLQHEVWKITLDGSLYLAPVKDPLGYVLDLEPGTGIWAAQLAQSCFTAKVHGVDLTKVERNGMSESERCTFGVGNIENDWTYDV